MPQYAFFVNSDACSGCKTCQVACKDAHDLPAGLHWRRVIEVTAGRVAEERRRLDAHRRGLPPVGRLPPLRRPRVRQAVLGGRHLEAARRHRAHRRQPLHECRKCESGLPVRRHPLGRSTNAVSKCDFCVDDLDAGRPPACVAACPNRALDFGQLDDLRRRFGPIDRVYPLEDPAASRPAIVLKPHRHAAAAAGRQPGGGELGRAVENRIRSQYGALRTRQN